MSNVIRGKLVDNFFTQAVVAEESHRRLTNELKKLPGVEVHGDEVVINATSLDLAEVEARIAAFFSTDEKASEQYQRAMTKNRSFAQRYGTSTGRLVGESSPMKEVPRGR